MAETPTRAETTAEADRRAGPRAGAGALGQFAAAWTCLTRLPWPGSVPAESGAIGRGAWAFPLVGAAIGALGGGAWWLASAAGLPALVAAALALGVTALATGALHEDGLADTADGLGGGRDRDHALSIMKGSAIGAYGTLALVLVTLARVGALAALAPLAGALALVGAAALGRAAATVPMALLPPARPGGAGAHAGPAPIAAMAAALFLGGGAALVLGWRASGFVPALAGLAAAALATALLCLAARRKLGGATGDVHGAVALAAETLCLAALAARP